MLNTFLWYVHWALFRFIRFFCPYHSFAVVLLLVKAASSFLFLKPLAFSSYSLGILSHPNNTPSTRSLFNWTTLLRTNSCSQHLFIRITWIERCCCCCCCYLDATTKFALKPFSWCIVKQNTCIMCRNLCILLATCHSFIYFILFYYILLFTVIALFSSFLSLAHILFVSSISLPRPFRFIRCDL